MTNLCEYCRRPVPQARRKFCNEVCLKRHRESQKALKAIAEGRLCERCKKPILGPGKRWCSRLCQDAAKVVFKVCCICMQRFNGHGKTCSAGCAKRLREKKHRTTETQKWLATRRNQPDLEMVPTKTYLFRRPLKTVSGIPVCKKCFVGEVLDFPEDRAVYAVIWKEGDYVYCQARRCEIAINTIMRLTDFDMRTLEDTLVKRTAKYD